MDNYDKILQIFPNTTICIRDYTDGFVICREKTKHFFKMPLFESKPIDEPAVKELVKQNWELELGACLKAFQNHVFLAQGKDETKFIVRVVPDLDGKKQSDIDLEVSLLDYLKSNNLPVCKVTTLRRNTEY